MSQLVRIFQIHRMLRGRRPPSTRELMESLDISQASLKRDLELMRSQLHAPIVWDREVQGYRYESEFELPGLWFKQDEIHALLLMNALLDQLQPGFLQDQLKPFEAKLRALVSEPAGVEQLLSRVRIVGTPQRPVEPEFFQAVCQATLERRRLKVRYFTRGRGEESERTLSPLKLIFYRANWYLDAWCHSSEEVRRFAVDAMREVAATEEEAFEPAITTPPENEGYGIFAGPAHSVATLHFAPTAARWVAEEEWHSRQRSTPLPDGGVQLEVPYGNIQEILMDVLRHGPGVEVIAPAELRNAVAAAHREAAAKYATPRRSAAGITGGEENSATG